ncbi:MAG: FAD-dependent oxidoreductase, partial [Bacteroidia bacterium]
MINELKHHESNTLGPYDICIVGSGPAGITLALKLQKAGKKVIVLEAGSFAPNAITNALKSGNKSTGQWYNIEGSRLVQLGGTSGHWAGYCAELDKEDYYLNNIDSVKWPFNYNELKVFDAEAAEILELGRAQAPNPKENEVIAFKNTFQEKMWRFSTPVRFGKKYKNLDIYTTFEGDNTVLLQQLVQTMLKKYKNNITTMEVIKYKINKYLHYLQSMLPNFIVNSDY